MSMAKFGASGRPSWFRSSYSNGAGGECVECLLLDHGVVVRDSKTAAGPVIFVGSSAWRSFVVAVERERAAR